MDNSSLLPLLTVSDEPSLFFKKPTTAIIYLILLFFTSIWGGATNILILIVHLMNKNLNKAGRIFLVNLCLADLCVNLVAIPFCIIGVTHGEEYFKKRPHLCRFIASFCFMACVCAILNLCMATINRYTYVCHNQIYMRFFRTRTSIGMAFVIWILALSVECSNLLGWGGHVFDKKSHTCIWDRLANFSFTLFVSIVLIICPLISTVLLNGLLLKRIYQTKLNICAMREMNNLQRKRHTWMETVRASRTLFMMCVAFVVCWLPYASIVAFDVNDTYSEEVHLFATLLAHMHSSMNFILYWLFNKEFSKSVYQILASLLSCPQIRSKSATSGFSPETSTYSSGSIGSHTNREQIYWCCQRRNAVKRNSSVTSTSVETFGSNSTSFKGENSVHGFNEHFRVSCIEKYAIKGNE